MAIIVENNIEFDVVKSLSCAVYNALQCISIKVCISAKNELLLLLLYRQPESKIEACIDIIVSFLMIKKLIYIYVEILI